MKTLKLALALLTLASPALAQAQGETIRRSESYVITQQGRTDLMLLGLAAEALYTSRNAVDFSNDQVPNAKLINGMVCAEVAKTPAYQGILSSWAITIFGTLTPELRFNFLRSIQRSRFVCVSHEGL